MKRTLGVVGGRAAVLVALLSLTAVLVAGCQCKSDSTDSTTVSGTGGFVTLPTKKCPTTEGIDRPDVPLNATTTIPVSDAGLEDFAAFTNTSGTMLIGPQAWKCDSLVAVDGGVRIGLTPDGSDPFEKGADIGITYDASAACQGCIAAEICAILPKAPVVLEYANMGVSCDRKKPLKETLTPIGDLSVMFEDPPGVKGQGDPSGGEVPSLGMLTYSKNRGTQQVSCAVPDDLAGACPSVISGSMLFAHAYLIQ